MSRRSRSQSGYNSNKGWRLIDSIDGTVIRSKDAIIDWDGSIRAKKNIDGMPVTMLPLKQTRAWTIPFSNPEQPDNYLVQGPFPQYQPGSYNETFIPRSGYTIQTVLPNIPDTHTYPFTGTNISWDNYAGELTFSGNTFANSYNDNNSFLNYTPVLGDIPNKGNAPDELEVSS